MKYKLKVLHIIGSGSIGGAEKLVFTLAKYQYLHSDNIIPSVLFVNQTGEFYEMIKDSGIHIELPVEDKSYLNCLLLFRKIFRKYDIIHFHGTYIKLFFPAICSGRIIIYFIHGSRYITKSLKQIINNTKIRKSYPTLNGLKRRMKKGFLSFFLNHYARTINSPSEYYKNYYVTNYGIKPEKIHITALGIDFSSYQITKSREQFRKELGIQDDTTVIGTITTYRKLKRVDRLVNAFKLLAVNNFNPDVKLLIVGNGEQKEAIINLIKNDNYLSDKAILLPADTNVSDYYNIFDIFVHPSESENFSITAVEAMYFGLPVVAYKDSGGLAELISKSGGYLVSTDEELSSLLLMLVRDPELRKSTGIRLKDYTETNLSVKLFCDNISNEYFTN